jgi:hypothetical protein
MKTTNYYNTFIEVAEDCPIKTGEAPPQKVKEKTVAHHGLAVVSFTGVQMPDESIFVDEIGGGPTRLP